MNRTQMLNKREALVEEARTLTRSDLSGDDLDRFEAIETEIANLDKHIKILARFEATGGTGPEFESGDGAAASAPQFMKRAGDPWADHGSMRSEFDARTRAATAIERWETTDDVKQNATVALERAEDPNVANHLLVTSKPAYTSAFRQMLADPKTGHQTWTPEERDAWRDVQMWSKRATLATSGAVLPSPLEPGFLLDNTSAVNPIRQLARRVTTTSKSHRFILSEGVVADYTAEGTALTDNTPTLREKTVDTHRLTALIRATLEAAQDQPNWQAEVGRLFADAMNRAESAHFWAGSGTNEPWGIMTMVDGTIGQVLSNGTEAFVASDVYKVKDALPVRFRERAVWLAEDSTIDAIHRFYNPSGSEPALVDFASGTILRKRFFEWSDMDPASGINPAATADNHILALVDPDSLLLVDRLGASIEFIENMVDTTSNLPMGVRGWVLYARSGFDVATREGGGAGAGRAIRVLDVPTTA